MRSAFLASLLLLAAQAEADVLPVSDKRDPRLATLSYIPGNSFRLLVPAGGEVSVLLPAGEAVTGVEIDQPGDWAVTASGNGQSFSVRPLRPLPDSLLTVQSSVRDYRFVLSTDPGTAPPMFVRIVGVPTNKAGGDRQASAAAQSNVWALRGNRELRPSSIRDDGRKIYLDWPASNPIPAIFAVDRLGREEMVNGFMRSGTFVIDRVYERLIFRIDRAHAEARRKLSRGPK